MRRGNRTGARGAQWRGGSDDVGLFSRSRRKPDRSQPLRRPGRIVALASHDKAQQNSCVSASAALSQRATRKLPMTNSIEKRIELQAPLTRVWRALTDHREFGEWFRVKLETPFAPGEI